MSMLLEQFNTIFDTPKSVNELQELILDMAVKGKLVPQDPNDEPASSLLEQIKIEKEQLIREKKIKKEKDLPGITEEEIPHQLPQGWEWVRLKDVTYNLGQKKPNQKFTYIDVGLIDKSNGIISEKAKLNVIPPENAPSRARKIVQRGSVIYSTVRPYLLNIAIVEDMYEYEPIVSTAFAALNTLNGVNNKYLYYFLRSRTFTKYVESLMVGMAYPAINESNFYKGIMPLPPLNEQKRIVEKIELLISICENLKDQIEKKQRRENSLNIYAFSSLEQSSTPEELEKNLSFILENFISICTDIKHIQQLRNAILSLAVKGKLVLQENDESASMLLEKIELKKEKLFKDKIIKKEKPLLPITEEEQPYELPKGWEWVRLGKLAKFVELGISSKASDENIGVPVLRMNNIVKSKVVLSNLKYLDYNLKELPRLYLKNGDLLFNRTNSYELVGKTGVFKGEDDKFTFASYLIRIRMMDNINPHYINYVINSNIYRKYQLEPGIIQQNGQANFNGTKLKNTLIPVPPLNEQKRIVQKVDQLMALCDELECKIKTANEQQEHLLQSVLYQTFQQQVTELLGA